MIPLLRGQRGIVRSNMTCNIRLCGIEKSCRSWFTATKDRRDIPLPTLKVETVREISARLCSSSFLKLTQEVNLLVYLTRNYGDCCFIHPEIIPYPLALPWLIQEQLESFSTLTLRVCMDEQFDASPVTGGGGCERRNLPGCELRRRYAPIVSPSSLCQTSFEAD